MEILIDDSTILCSESSRCYYYTPLKYLKANATIMTKQKKIAAIQSSYIPWKGYFDIINMVDEFILLDDIQYTRRDWRNRNKIKSSNGAQWLSIPVNAKGKYYQKINETLIKDLSWAKKHWRTITVNYSKAPYFKDYRHFFEEYYLKTEEINLSNVNYQLIKIIMKHFKY